MSGEAWIDGRIVEPVPGETILAAARRHGIDVPTLCHVEGLPPPAGCRICLVEVEGEPRPRAACHSALAPGMRVRSDSPSLAALRRDLLALHVEGEALRGDFGGTRFGALLARHGVVAPSHEGDDGAVASHPYLRFDAARCITCRRCLTTCADLQGSFVYGIGGRGFRTALLIGPEDRFETSPCTACGACVDACPTGALFDVDRESAVPADATTETVCGYCGVGCRVEVTTRAGGVARIRGVPGAAVNRGHTCAKGRFAHGWQSAPDRLRTPLLRTGPPSDPRWREISWAEATARIAEALAAVRERHGAGALGALSSSRSTNEAAYLLQKLFRAVLGTNHVDCCARVCHASTAMALQLVTGTGAASTCYDDIEVARRIVVAGANPTEAHPVVGARILQASRRGARLAVIDPRRIDLCDVASLHLPVRPGANVAAFHAIAKLLLGSGRVDAAYLAERCEGEAELREFLARLSLDDCAREAGVAVASLRELADLLAEGPTLFVWGLGLSELVQGVGSVMALANLAMLTGSVGRVGAGLMPLRGQNNVQGNADMGSMPAQLTGYQPLDDALARARIAREWGAAPPEEPGLTIPEMFEAARARALRALWIMGEDVAQSDPDEARVLEALESLDFLVVQELFLTETARRAHVVLPAAGYLEQEGTFTNAERRIQHVRPALAPPGDARPDWIAVREVARALGADWRYASPGEVMDEIARVAPALFGGVSYARLEGDGLQWPCPSAEHPGTARVHERGFLRGKGLLVAVPPLRSSEHDVPGHPYLLVTGRVLHQYNVGTMTRRTPQQHLAPADWLDIHPEDARREGIAAGRHVVVSSRWGEARVAARITPRTPPGILFLSFHQPETHANRITGPARDPRSNCPQYKATAVRLRTSS
ncbi:MAG TPA: formate dehydrogenase subunit alpha [Myxococcota bacterium]|nr:formate dehydrogenase subunit alpha [Myxococcota bacterium]